MSLSVVQALCIAAVTAVLWRLFGTYVVKSSLSKLPGPPRSSFWIGTFKKTFDKNGVDYNLKVAEEHGSTIRVYGFFGSEALYTFDPLALHHIFVKHQYIYEESDTFIAHNSLVFGCSLLSTLGEQHRKQRKMLNPVFSLKHMRGLIPVFYPIAHKLREVLKQQVLSGKKDINVMMWMSRAALEYIGQGGLGYSFDALDESKKNTYSEVIKMLGPTESRMVIVLQTLPYLVNLGPAWLRRIAVRLIPSRLVQRLRHIIDVMDETSRDILSKKKAALAKGDEAVVSQIGQGKDIMSLLLRANMDADESEKLPETEILGQMTTFIFAGHDTTTSAISRVLHLLALNPRVQEKLRAEVTEARAKHGDLDYDVLMGLPYLDAVSRETLRMYPPVPTTIRTTREDVVLPLMWPVKSSDGKTEITSIPLKKDTNVFISILNANRSKQIWGPDADKWKPERWLSPLPDSVVKARLPGVYASMMTFIGGGRACIGFKFAEMELKLVLSILLETFVFSPGNQEVHWILQGLQTPVAKDSPDNTPSLPLKVTFVKDRYD